jgi:lysozyme
MQYGKGGLHLTESFEQCRLIPYLDSAGVWTNGWGNTHGVVPGQSITQEKADSDLMANVQNAVNAVNRLVHVPLTQNEFDALVDFTFNAGEGNFAASTMLRWINDSNFDAAQAEFARWDMAGGAHLAGLARRRQAEADLWGSP